MTSRSLAIPDIVEQYLLAFLLAAVDFAVLADAFVLFVCFLARGPSSESSLDE